MGEKNKESTWSTCRVLLSELVSLLQLAKPPLIYVLRGHDTNGQLIFHIYLYSQSAFYTLAFRVFWKKMGVQR